MNLYFYNKTVMPLYKNKDTKYNEETINLTITKMQKYQVQWLQFIMTSNFINFINWAY